MWDVLERVVLDRLEGGRRDQLRIPAGDARDPRPNGRVDAWRRNGAVRVASFRIEVPEGVSRELDLLVAAPKTRAGFCSAVLRR